MSSNSSIQATKLRKSTRISQNTKDKTPTSDPLRRLRTGKRGRPQIDPAQEGLVERRRNQVRKAQRTYRIRKDDETAVRRDYVADLESRIGRMERSFLELRDLVTEIDPKQTDLKDKVQDITRDFLSASAINEPPAYNHDPKTRPNLVPVELPVSLRIQAGNFAQRLHLSCIKRAYHLLTSPHADKTEIARVFQYSFRYSDSTSMISTFDTLLKSGDYRTARVYRLGGAGTHYKTSPEAGIVTDVLDTSESEIWFDPRDIEGWLQENGLVIGGAQSFMYLSEVPAMNRAALILNVDLFLQELLSRGACLGNAPGFRRLDVETSFKLALSDETTFQS